MAGSDAQGGVAAPLREGDKDRLIADLHRRVDELTAALAARATISSPSRRTSCATR
jgi:hypothetical protein